MWLTGHYGIPLVTKCLPTNPYFEKQRISLGVAIIQKNVSSRIPKLIAISLINNSRRIYMFQDKRYLLVVKTLTKSGCVNQQPWISSHFNQLPKVIAPSKIHLRTALSKIRCWNCLSKECISKLLSQKHTFQNCYHKDIFISAFINAIKNKTCRDKSLIIHD